MIPPAYAQGDTGMRRHGSGRVMGYPFVRTGCAAFLLLPCGLGIWGGWAAFASGDAIPANVLLFFCALPVLMVMLYALALHWHWRTAIRRNTPDPDDWPALATMLLSALALAIICTFLPMYGPIFTIRP